MSAASTPSLAERKRVLASRAALERAEMDLALYDLRATLAVPRPSSAAAAKRSKTIASVLVMLAMPLLGRSRLGRLVRAGSMLLAGLRFAQRWFEERR